MLLLDRMSVFEWQASFYMHDEHVKQGVLHVQSTLLQDLTPS